MLVLSLLVMAASAIAAPYLNSTACRSRNNTQAWTVFGFETFSAAPSPQHVNKVSFQLYDPFVGYQYPCSQKISTPGAKSGLDTPQLYHGCANTSMQFEWDGTRLFLKERVQCGNTTVELSGSEGVFDLLCYEIEDDGLEGKTCETALGQFSIAVQVP